MIIIRTDILLYFGLYGIAWFPPFIFVHKDADYYTINEEKTHIIQWVHLAPVAALMEIGLYYAGMPVWLLLIMAYFSRWLWYVAEYTVYRIQGQDHRNAYMRISFEIEAKLHAYDEYYWKWRPFWGNLRYL